MGCVATIRLRGPAASIRFVAAGMASANCPAVTMRIVIIFGGDDKSYGQDVQ